MKTVEIIVRKYLSGSYSEEEQALFWEYMKNPKYRNLIEDIIANELDKELQNYPEQHRIEETLPIKVKELPKNKIPLMNKWWAVAVVSLLVLGIVTSIYMSHVDTNKMIAFQAVGAPGTNKASLILADGTEVSLDDLPNNEVTEFDGVSYRKGSDSTIIVVGAQHSTMNTLKTPNGGKYALTLPDGSRVWMNVASTLSYPTNFSKEERRVYLQGEAYFEVTRTPGQASIPFVVEVAGREIAVLGTSFNINAYEDEPAITTTLLTGSVKVLSGGTSKMLKPGQQAIDKGHELKVTETVAENAIDWKNGDFLLSGENLQSIMRKVARWYDVEVVYEDAECVTEDRFGGEVSRSKTLTEVLNILSISGGDIKFDIRGRTVYVSRNLNTT